MRITEFIHTLLMGGAERLAVDLAVRLARRGHETSVVCLHFTGPLEEELRDNGVEVLCLNKETGLDLKPLIMLRNFLSERRVDIVHSHNTHLHHHGVVAARSAGVTGIVNTVHGLVNVPTSGRAKMIYQAAALTTDRITTVCEPVRKALHQQLSIPARLVEIARNGIEPQKFLSVPARGDDGTVTFGTIGRFVDVKNHLGLVEGFAKLHALRPNTRLRLMGYGPLDEALRAKITELGLSSCVDLVPGTDDGAKFLASLDVFVLSSLSEGLPMSLLEAMAAGRPVIGTPVGAIPEVIEGGRCGWVSRSPAPDALRDAMVSAVDAPNRAELGTLGRRHVLDQYTLEEMTNQYERLFERVLAEKLAPRAVAAS